MVTRVTWTEHTAAFRQVRGGDRWPYFIHYDNNGVIKLVIIDPGGDGNWMDNKFSSWTSSRSISLAYLPARAATRSR